MFPGEASKELLEVLLSSGIGMQFDYPLCCCVPNSRRPLNFPSFDFTIFRSRNRIHAWLYKRGRKQVHFFYCEDCDDNPRVDLGADNPHAIVSVGIEGLFLSGDPETLTVFLAAQLLSFYGVSSVPMYYGVTIS
jgi:hypothetical protein